MFDHNVTVIMSHPARGAWIEIVAQNCVVRNLRSHPARGAWIEIALIVDSLLSWQVAPRKGCVD